MLGLQRNGAVGFIDWLGHLAAPKRHNPTEGHADHKDGDGEAEP